MAIIVVLVLGYYFFRKKKINGSFRLVIGEEVLNSKFMDMKMEIDKFNVDCVMVYFNQCWYDE